MKSRSVVRYVAARNTTVGPGPSRETLADVLEEPGIETHASQAMRIVDVPKRRDSSPIFIMR
jgi:hypothetical protein